jgi:hypothetical protein
MRSKRRRRTIDQRTAAEFGLVNLRNVVFDTDEERLRRFLAASSKKSFGLAFQVCRENGRCDVARLHHSPPSSPAASREVFAANHSMASSSAIRHPVNLERLDVVGPGPALTEQVIGEVGASRQQPLDRFQDHVTFAGCEDSIVKPGTAAPPIDDERLASERPQERGPLRRERTCPRGKAKTMASSSNAPTAIRSDWLSRGVPIRDIRASARC